MIASPHAWVIRPLRECDVVRVAAVLGLARLHRAAGRYLVAWDGDTPVGHVHVTRDDPPEIQDLEVRHGYRRRGVAVALIDAAEHEAKGRHAAVVRLEVSADNAPARQLYEKQGYVLAPTEPRRVDGVVVTRAGPIEVHALLLRMEKYLV